MDEDLKLNKFFFACYASKGEARRNE